MAPNSLTPVTLRSVKQMLETLGYTVVYDDGEDFVWKKTGPILPGAEAIFDTWPNVVTHHYPSFKADGHDTMVYDRSDVTDLIVEITGKDRTSGVKVVALLRAAATCQKCGSPAQITKVEGNMSGATYKCVSADCGHEEHRSV